MSAPPPIPIHITNPALNITADQVHPDQVALFGGGASPLEGEVVTNSQPIAPRAALTHIYDVAPFDIDLSAGAQMRVERSEATVDEYAEAMKGGAVFPMPVVYCERIDAEGRPLDALILADGFHRVAAARRAEVVSITVELRQGTRREAVLHAMKANTEHGLRPSRADTRKAVVTLLTDEEWRRWSDREIARRTGAHHKTVGRIRKELGESAESSERIYLRDGEERLFEMKPPTPEEEATAALFPTSWPVIEPALPPFPDASPAVPDVAPVAHCATTPEPQAVETAATCDDEPDLITFVGEEDEPADPYATLRNAAPEEAPRRRVYPAIIDEERDLDPATRHVLRRWVWTHGDVEGLPSIARLSDMPADLDGREDADAPEWCDLDMHLFKLVKKGLLERKPNGKLKASRTLYRTYTDATYRMRHIAVRQDDWAKRRGDEISEQLGASHINYIIPSKDGTAAIQIGFGEYGAEHTEIFLVADDDASRELGRVFEQPLKRLEALVKLMKGVK